MWAPQIRCSVFISSKQKTNCGVERMVWVELGGVRTTSGGKYDQNIYCMVVLGFYCCEKTPRTRQLLHLIGVCVQFQRFSLLSSWWEAWFHAWHRNNSWVISWIHRLRKRTRPSMGFPTSSNKATCTTNNVNLLMLLILSNSFTPCCVSIHIYEPKGPFLIKLPHCYALDLAFHSPSCLPALTFLVPLSMMFSEF